MHIDTRNEFAADPQAVTAMLRSREFLQECCAATRPLRYEVEVTDSLTRTSRAFPAPSVAQKFVRGDLVVVEEILWGATAPDGSCAGQVQVSSPGLPVVMHGSVTVDPGGRGTIVGYQGDLKVNIPLIGHKLEQEAAPALLEAMRVQQERGDAWLASA